MEESRKASKRRFLIGKRITDQGIDQDCKQTLENSFN